MKIEVEKLVWVRVVDVGIYSFWFIVGGLVLMWTLEVILSSFAKDKKYINHNIQVVPLHSVSCTRIFHISRDEFYGMVGQRGNKQTRHPGRCCQKRICFAVQEPSRKRSALYCWLKEKTNITSHFGSRSTLRYPTKCIDECITATIS